MKVLPSISTLMSLEHQGEPMRPRTDVRFGLGFLGVAAGWPSPRLLLLSTAGCHGGHRPACPGKGVGVGEGELKDYLNPGLAHLLLFICLIMYIRHIIILTCALCHAF